MYSMMKLWMGVYMYEIYVGPFPFTEIYHAKRE